MPTLRGWALSGAGSALLLLWFGFGDPELLLAGALVLIAQVLSLVIVRLRRPEIEIGRRLGSADVHDGDTTTVTLIISNLANRSVASLTIEDNVNRLGVATFEAAKMGKGETTTATYRLTCRPRGVYRVGPTAVHSSDPLGLAVFRTLTGPIDRIVVFPAVEDLSGYPTVRGQDPSMQASRPKHTSQGGEDFYALREYQEGDDLRRVHWPSSAKTDDLLIRQLETPWRSRALVLLDTRSGVYASPDAFERAVSGAASVVTHLIGSGFDTDLCAGDGEIIDTARYRSAMEELALVTLDQSIDIEAVAFRIRKRGRGGVLVFVTGTADRSLLGVKQHLSADYPTTVLMTVSDSIPQALTGIQRMSVITVSTRPDEPWAQAWIAAMRSPWATASVE